jgi:uncharacterized protein
MGASTDKTEQTRKVANSWFNAVSSGDISTAMSCLADDVEWINYTVVPGYNDIMPWIGTYHGVDAVIETFKVFTSLSEVQHEQLQNLAVDGEEAAGVVHEISLVRETNLTFEIEFVQWLTVRNGKIVRWKSYTDPSTIIRALEEKRPPVDSMTVEQNSAADRVTVWLRQIGDDNAVPARLPGGALANAHDCASVLPSCGAGADPQVFNSGLPVHRP